MTSILILGTGCAKCVKLYELAGQAARELRLDHQLTKITDLNQIMAFGVMTTPALVVDGKVKLAGKLPSVEELKSILLPSANAVAK